MEKPAVPDAPAGKVGLRRDAGISRSLRAACDQFPPQENPRAIEAVEFRAVGRPSEMETVYRLTHDAYVDMGYIAPRPDRRHAHYPHLDFIPQTTVVLALTAGRIVGTASLTLDGPAGLHVDEDFKVETDRIRAEGRRLAASYRIVTDKDYRHRQDIVMGLLKEIARRALEAQVQTGLFIFHKRHEGLYEKLFHMKTVAELPEIRCCINDFHAVFMRCDFEDLPKFWFRRPPVAEVRSQPHSAFLDAQCEGF